VFAYSNRTGDPHEGDAGERALVVYHNTYAETSGWVKSSAAYMEKSSGNLVQKTLAEGLGLPGDGYAIFNDYVNHLEYIRPCGELIEKGLFVRLGAYQCQVFMDWRFVHGEQWRVLYEALIGVGVQSMQVKYDELFVVKEEVKSEKGKKPSKRVRSKIPTRKPVGKRALKKTIKTKKGKSTSKRKTKSKDQTIK
jgi:hypothetical protein